MINIVNIVYVPSLIQQKVLFLNLCSNVLHHDIVAKTEFLTYFLCSTFLLIVMMLFRPPKTKHRTSNQSKLLPW